MLPNKKQPERDERKKENEKKYYESKTTRKQKPIYNGE